MSAEYTIEKKRNGKAVFYKNGHDVYIKILLNNSSEEYFIPVMLPRRDPGLNFYDILRRKETSEDFLLYIDTCVEKLSSEGIDKWKKMVSDKYRSDNTQKGKFLRILIDENKVCSSCMFTPITNNPQKPIQNLRDVGFVISTHRALRCDKCGKNTVHYILTPVLTTDKNNYELVSKKLKEAVCRVYEYIDSYSEIYNPSPEAFIADHKFPEDRWDKDTAKSNPEDMSDEDIRSKFQLLSTQMNLHKQRCCAQCIASKKRGYPYGIKYYYIGGEDWSAEAEYGEQAEAGCVGCGWYDLLKWKEELNKVINNK